MASDRQPESPAAGRWGEERKLPHVRVRPERRNTAIRERLRRRVLAQFEDTPWMRLTWPQACRLLDVRADVCKRVLTGLVEDGLLSQGLDGRYVKRGPTR